MKETTKQILNSFHFPSDLPEDFVLREFRRAYGYNHAILINESRPSSAKVSFDDWINGKGTLDNGETKPRYECLKIKYKKKIDFDSTPSHRLKVSKKTRRIKKQKNKNKNQNSLIDILYGD